MRGREIGGEEGSDKERERIGRKRALMIPRQPSSRLFAGIRSVDLHEKMRRNGREGAKPPR